MKTLSVLIFSLFLSTILVPQSANCQWYYKQYDVGRINDLTHVQYEDALQKVAKITKIGVNLTLGGVVGFGLGFYSTAMGVAGALGSGLYGSNQNTSAEVRYMVVGGSVLVVLATSAIAVGIPFWITGIVRKSDINKAFGKCLSQISFSPNITWHHNRSYMGAKISIPIAFN